MDGDSTRLVLEKALGTVAGSDGVHPHPLRNESRRALADAIDARILALAGSRIAPTLVAGTRCRSQFEDGALFGVCSLKVGHAEAHIAGNGLTWQDGDEHVASHEDVMTLSNELGQAELRAAERVADEQRERAKRAERALQDTENQLAEIHNDRLRALKRANDFTQDTQTLDEAVAALIECTRLARRGRDETERKLAAVSEEERALRKENDALRAQLRVVQAERDDVWFWQGDGDEPGSLACPVVMSAETLRTLIARSTDPG